MRTFMSANTFERRPFVSHREELSLAEVFFAAWALVIPMSSFLVVPAIQGTTPAAVLSPMVAIWAISSRRAWSTLIVAVFFWTFFLIFSQIGIGANSGILLHNLRAIDPTTQEMGYRTSLFTQTAYLIPCLALFIFLQDQFCDSWLKYIAAGGWLLAVYAIIEWIYFILYQEPFTFLANRTYEYRGEEYAGSVAQQISLGPLAAMRLKGFTREPGFYAATALPYLAIALSTGRWKLYFVLAVSLLLTFSTTAYLGFVIVSVTTLFYRKHLLVVDFMIFTFATLLGLFVAISYPDVFAGMFAEKFIGENISGNTRIGYMQYAYSYFWDLPLMCKLFGVGFGTTYLPSFSRVLLDMGLVGLLLFALFVFYPLRILSSTALNVGIKTALVALAFFWAVSFPELFFPTNWLVLGIAYHQMHDTQRLTAC